MPSSGDKDKHSVQNNHNNHNHNSLFIISSGYRLSKSNLSYDRTK